MSARIYVADLAEYNAGNLIGKWFDLEEFSDSDELSEAVEAMVSARGNEEFAIHDYEGFGPISIGEYDSLDTVMTHLERMGDEPAKYFAYIAANGEHYADEFDADNVEGPFGSKSEAFDSEVENELGTLSLQEWLQAQGMSERLSMLVRFDSEDAWELMLSANEGRSVVEVEGNWFIINQ